EGLQLTGQVCAGCGGLPFAGDVPPSPWPAQGVVDGLGASLRRQNDESDTTAARILQKPDSKPEFRLRRQNFGIFAPTRRFEASPVSILPSGRPFSLPGRF
ncbi:MAG TPA: hypothetical protein VGG20_25735, partial [Thermoanaerobaculia bacterium]